MWVFILFHNFTCEGLLGAPHPLVSVQYEEKLSQLMMIDVVQIEREQELFCRECSKTENNLKTF